MSANTLDPKVRFNQALGLLADAWTQKAKEIEELKAKNAALVKGLEALLHHVTTFSGVDPEAFDKAIEAAKQLTQ